MFKCVTAGQDYLTGWKLNGTLWQDLPPEIESKTKLQAINHNGTRLEYLRIEARVEYNGTLVQCLILSTDGFSMLESENATLTVLGNTTLHLVLCAL